MRLGTGHSATGHDGQFAFVNVPVGTRSIGLDTGALPIDFDPPAVSQIQVELSRGDAKRVAFGLVPLGIDRRAGHPRREWKRQGRPERGTHRRRRRGSRQRRAFRAGAKRSIPVRGRAKRDTPRQAADRIAPGRRDHCGRRRSDRRRFRSGALSADVSFLVSVEKRPEIRRVFPSRGGTPAASTHVAAADARSERPRRAEASRSSSATSAPAEPSRDTGAETFAIQIAALNDAVASQEPRPVNSRHRVSPAYLVEPPATDPDCTLSSARWSLPVSRRSAKGRGEARSSTRREAVGRAREQIMLIAES